MLGRTRPSWQQLDFEGAADVGRERAMLDLLSFALEEDRAEISVHGLEGETPSNPELLDLIRQFVYQAVGEGKVQDVDVADHFSEPGYSKDGDEDLPILLGDWNASRWNPWAEVIGEYAMLAGFTVDWGEGYIVCENCQGAFRTMHDSYGWQMYGWVNLEDYFWVCGDCLLEDEDIAQDYIDSFVNNPDSAVRRFVDPEDHGWAKVPGYYTGGMRRGQTDHPRPIAEVLEDAGLDYVFRLRLVGQFDMSFWVYVREGNEDKARKLLEDHHLAGYISRWD